jgi:hypothetical protein
MSRKRQLMKFEGRKQHRLLNKITITTGNKVNHCFQLFHVDISEYCPQKKEPRKRKKIYVMVTLLDGFLCSPYLVF